MNFHYRDIIKKTSRSRYRISARLSVAHRSVQIVVIFDLDLENYYSTFSIHSLKSRQRSGLIWIIVFALKMQTLSCY